MAILRRWHVAWCWCNQLSLDAVMIALAWQSIFTLGFVDRWPSLAESAALAGSVWLIYTSDRLLDARYLDKGRPHTQRHRFHHDWQMLLTIVWTIVLSLVAFLVLSYLPMRLLRTGLMVATSVLVYGGCVHFIESAVVPKEFLVGSIFAAGVSLIAWTHRPSIELLWATVIAATVFMMNCRMVAMAESVVDNAQSFHSRTLNALDTLITSLWAPAMLVVFTIAASLPPLVAASLIVATVSLPFGRRWLQDRHAEPLDDCVTTTPMGAWADITLVWVPILMLICR
ncbi:MAG: hypothetical protein AAGC97_03935 [Planctomycetota bacterium]